MPAPNNRRRAALPESASLVERAITRGVSNRYAAAEEDVSRIIDATYRVIERTGTVDPRVRDILEEAGLSSPAFYRHFSSKDELLLVILDDGRRRLADYLAHRMAKAADGVGRVRAWIEGVVAQAVDRNAASRTRPFLANTSRLADQFPAEQESSQQLLLALLVDAVREARRDSVIVTDDPARDARAVFDLTFAFMERHVLAGTRPTAADVKHLVAFCERALGAESEAVVEQL
jgi:AcrR family transcriptional regulator